MIEEVYKNIYRIPVPLTGNPLKEVNCYYIKGEDRNLIIDTGFRCDECKEVLTAGLNEAGWDPKKTDVYLTHLHSDHTGLAFEICGPGRNIYISSTDQKYMIRNLRGEEQTDKQTRFLQDGFTLEMLQELSVKNPAWIYKPKGDLTAIPTVEDGDVLKVGEYELKVIVTPGHTPGNTMLWEEKHGLMFTGDNILFDITPNITSWPGQADSLGDYLDSLRRVRSYPVKLALPAHRMTGDYAARIDALLAHHEARLAEALKVIKENPGSNAHTIAGHMTWRIRARNWEEFPIAQKWFAVGECQSHLDYLEKRGLIKKVVLDGNRNVYYAL